MKMVKSAEMQLFKAPKAYIRTFSYFQIELFICSIPYLKSYQTIVLVFTLLQV